MKRKSKGFVTLLTLWIAIMLLSAAIDFLSTAMIPFSSSKDLEERACVLPDLIQDRHLRLSTRCISCEEAVPLFEILGAPNSRYLRVFIGEIYEDGYWKSEKASSSTLKGQIFSPTQEVFQFSKDLKGEIVIKPLTTFQGFIPTILYTTRLESTISLEYYSTQKVFFAEKSFKSSYKIQFQVFYYENELLNIAKLVMIEAYLQLPKNIPTRISSLAKNITANFQSPYEKLMAIETYLRTHYNYSKEFESAPTGQDPVDWFLFEEKRGVCIHFNTAFVILARSLGIPARLVCGYLIEPSAENQKVYANHAHAYSEVQFEGLGWIPFDATPSGERCRCFEKETDKEGRTKKDLILVEGNASSHIPLLTIFGIPETSYLRATIGEIYDYGTWRVAENAQTVSYKGEELTIEVLKFTSSSQGKIFIKPEQTICGFIPTILYANNLLFDRPLKYYPKQRSFFSDQDFGSTYSVSFTVYDFDGYLLKNAQLVMDNDYLQLPNSLTNRTIKLALSITEDIETPYEKLCALESYLKQNYKYDKNYSKAPSGWEPVDWFLFEEKRGVCTQFNTALAILARSVGIPCRVVSGYLIDAYAENQTVYADQAHLYVEVQFKDLGWVQFDATPSQCRCRCRCRLGSFQKKIRTFTEITEASTMGIKGNEFYVQGTVVDERSEKVSGLAVLIYLKRTPSEEGLFCGSGIVKRGEFKITCKTPIEVDVGNYWIIAHTIGNEEFLDSLSEDIPSLGAWAIVTPKIDGIISNGEWSDATSKKFTLNVHGEVHNAEIFAKNDETNLYLMAVIFDGDYNPKDGIWFIFDDNDLLYIEASGTYEDYCLVYNLSHYERVLDTYYYGGTNDIIGYVRHTNPQGIGYYVFELSHPLRSSDTDHDFLLSLGHKIQFKLEFDDVFNGRAYSVYWPHSSISAEIKAMPPKLLTITEITSASQKCAKGDIFYVEGKVTQKNGLPVDGLTVKVYLKRKKESDDAILCDIGTVKNGSFKISCKAPLDLTIGDYFLVAQTIGNDRYEGSWSDPSIKIMSRTKLSLSSPKEVVVGRLFTIQGMLEENETGQKIPSETVTLWLESEKLTDLLTDNDGQFKFSYTIYKPGNYTLRAVFLGSEYYFGSESEVVVNVLLPSIIINTKNIMVRSTKSDISGRVLIRDSPLIGVQIIISFDAKIIAMVNCDDTGSFKVEYTIPSDQNLGNALINYTLPHFGVSQSQIVTVYAKTYIQYKAPTFGYPRDTFQISAILSDDLGLPLCNASLKLIYYSNNGENETWSKTNFKGESFFNISLPLNYKGSNFTFIIIFDGEGFYMPSKIEGKIPLKTTEAQIIYQAPETISAGETFKIVATLLDSLKNPISEAKLILNCEGEGIRERRESITNGTGQTVFLITLPNNFQAPNLGFIITFEGTGFYGPSQVSGQIRVLTPFFLGQFVFPLIFSVVIGSVAITLYFMRRRLTKKTLSLAIEGETREELEIKKPSEAPAQLQQPLTHEEKRDRASIIIEFPDIKHPLPNTWGVNEPLRIKLRLLDSDDIIMRRAKLNLILDEAECEVVFTDNSGETVISKTFDEKGFHKIEVHYQDDRKYEKSSTECIINIVDYREEVVNLFNSCYKNFRTKGINLSDQTTTRELQLKVLEAFKTVDRRALEEFISVFELAAYSNHKVRREHYERAYLSLSLIDSSLKEESR